MEHEYVVATVVCRVRIPRHNAFEDAHYGPGLHTADSTIRDAIRGLQSADREVEVVEVDDTVRAVAYADEGEVALAVHVIRDI